ncbi:MAG: radical SAM protein, partial [Bacteroidetes bacterium]|nr:radical SAM protein [Bacteroidota bacterium]
YVDFVKHGLAYSKTPTEIERKTKPKSLTVWFHISNACNLSCSYCYIPKLMKAVDLALMDKHFMSTETVTAATKNLFEFCVKNQFTHLQIKFAGGEPTLNLKSINQTCAYAEDLSKEYGVKVGFRILTNAVFIDDAIFETFKKYKFGVSISVDGDEERHNEVRFTIPRSRLVEDDQGLKREGSWKTVNENIDRLLAQGNKPYILCTVTEKNYKHLFRLVEYCVSKNIGFRLSPVRDRNSHLKPDLLANILSELIEVYDWIGENLPSSMPIERFARFAEWNLSVPKQSVCGTCKSTMSIDQEGKVASCQMRMDKPFGNVNNEELASIFDKIRGADDNKYLTYPETKSEDCSICYWKYSCAGGCPEHTRIAKGTINSSSPWCHLYQDLLPHYIRAIAKQIKRAIDAK